MDEKMCYLIKLLRSLTVHVSVNILNYIKLQY